MSSSRFDKRVLGKAFLSPLVILLLLVGAGPLLLGLAAGGLTSVPGALGVGMIALGLGVAAYRWLVRADDLAREVAEEEQDEAYQHDRSRLTRLRRRLRTDEDPRTSQCADKLSDLRKRMRPKHTDVPAGGSPVLPELRAKAQELFQLCLNSLDRSVELRDAAGAMATDEARDELLRSRDGLIGEVVQGVDHLGATVDHLQASALRVDVQEQDLNRVRDELEMGLAVARRVEQRVNELEGDIGRRERSR